MNGFRSHVTVAWLAIAAACTVPADLGTGHCDQSHGCPAGQLCINGLCGGNGGAGGNSGGSGGDSGGSGGNTGGGVGGGIADGGDDGGPGDAGDGPDAGPVPLADYCAVNAEAQCRRLIGCGSLRPQELTLCEQQSPSCTLQVGLVNVGTNDYDGVAARACATKTLQKPCQGSAYPPLECGQVFTLKPPHCNASCATGSCDHNTCNPQCQPYRAVGEPCLPYNVGADCNPFTGICNPLPDGGQACAALHNFGDVCTGADCSPSTYCPTLPPPDAGPKRCLSQTADGTACTLYSSCLSGLCNSTGKCGYAALDGGCRTSDCSSSQFCMGYSVTATSVLGRCSPRLPAGASCAASTTYDDGCADAGMTCIDGICQQSLSFSRAKGQQCNMGFKAGCQPPDYCTLECGPDLYCNNTDGGTKGTCVSLGDAGEACTGLSCQAGLTCGLVPGAKCVAYAQPGQSCMAAPCTDFSLCAAVADGGSECKLRPQVYEACVGGPLMPCINSFCGPDAGCVPLLAPGAACSGVELCSLGLCQATHTCPVACQ